MYRTKKALGQHFLTDSSVLNRLIGLIRPEEGQSFLEIGPGLGALTTYLLPLIKKLSVVEIDRDVLAGLQHRCQSLGQLTVFHQDALTFDLNQLSEAPPYRIVGNLPYNISSPLIFHLLNDLGKIRDMHFMLQKEVVERLVAGPGDSSYGRLSVMVQYHCEAFNLMPVPPEAFSPPPKVDSAVVRLLPREQLIGGGVKNYSLFETIVKAAFGQRRKTLRNTLRNFLKEEDFSRLGIDSQLRAENLEVEAFVKVANYFVSISP